MRSRSAVVALATLMATAAIVVAFRDQDSGSEPRQLAGSLDIRIGTPTATSTPTATPTPGADTANCWVNITAGASPARISTAGVYDSTKAYSSLGAALAACNSGDVIGVNPNTGYGDQSLTSDKTSETTILAQGSTFDSVDFEANHVTMSDFIVDGSSVHIGGDDVHTLDMKIHGAGTDLLVNGDQYVWAGGEMGFEGWNPEDRNLCTGPEPIEIKGAVHPVFQDIDLWHQERLNDPMNLCDHLEYIRVDIGGSDATFIRVFHHDEGLEESNTSLLFITAVSNGATYDGLTLINTYWGDSTVGVVINVHENVDLCTNWKIAYSTFRTSAYVESTAGGTNACSTSTAGTLWVGNLGVNSSFHPCRGTHILDRWQHNIAGSCGTDNWTIGPAFGVGNLGFDTTTGRLQSGSPALTGGETTYCASLAGNVDLLGRPRTGTCSAGAFQGVG